VTRGRLIPAISISAVLVILTFSGLALFREWKSRQARVDQRFPLQGLGYCTSNPVKPCVVSFSQDSDGNMLVNFLTDGVYYPDFYLTIRAGENDHIYVCKKVSKFATSVYCTGKTLPVGEVFQFMIFSLNEEVLLAQGNLSIIGMALAMPGISSTPTPKITVSPTDDFVPPESTPSPSYPSYPGPRP